MMHNEIGPALARTAHLAHRKLEAQHAEWTEKVGPGLKQTLARVLLLTRVT